MKGYWRIIGVLLLLSQLVWSCSESDDDVSCDAKFSYETGQDDNHIVFKNESTGDYYSVEWDFGNGETESTSSKSKSYEVYYPQAGDYTVTLTIKTNSGDRTESTQVVTISQDDPNYDGSMQLVWFDEFDGPAVNMNNWTYEIGTGDWGWGNDELQYYTNGENSHIQDGKLIITAKKVDDKKARGSYTSTRMITMGKQEFTYGKIEVRAKLPSGTGVWPAIWMLGANISSVGWPACGEIDIMEYVGFEPNTIHSTVHTPSGSGANGNGNKQTLESAEEEFHLYGLLWEEDKLVFYIDTPENVTHTYAPANKNGNNWPFNKPHFFILNIAVGGTWGGAQGIDNSIFPQTMEVDYVRVYQKK